MAILQQSPTADHAPASPVGWVEVTEDQFHGSTKYPLMSGRNWDERRPCEQDQFPAGLRQCLYERNWEMIGVCVSVGGRWRYWLKAGIPVMTNAEADAKYEDSLAQAAMEIAHEMEERASAMGMTVAQMFNKASMAQKRAKRKHAAKMYRDLDKLALDRAAARRDGG